MPTILITGASRGLGLEYVKQYLADGWRVHACARDVNGELAKLKGDLVRHALDVTDHAAVDALAKEIKDEPIDVLLNNAGQFGPPGFDNAQQGVKGMNFKAWRDVLEANTLAPYKLAQAFLPHLKRGVQKRVAMMSTEMASLAGVKKSGMTSTIYQSSKAALNMASLSLAHELKDEGIALVLLHPGWVKTDMGGASAPLEAKDSVVGLRKVIANLQLKDTGRYCDWQGKDIDW